MRILLTELPDALRKLKIITSDIPCIDLTADRDTSPHVTLEQYDDSSASEAIRRRVWSRQEFVVSRSRWGRRRTVSVSYKQPTDAEFVAELNAMRDAPKETKVRKLPATSGCTTASQPLEPDRRPATITSQISQNSSAPAPIHDTGTANAALPSRNDRTKKRRALEDALEDIEFEQRKRRVQRELARLEEDAE